MVESLPSKQAVEGSSPFGRSIMEIESNLSRKRKLILAHLEDTLDEILLQEQLNADAGQLATAHTVKINLRVLYSGDYKEIISKPTVVVGAVPVE